MPSKSQELLILRQAVDALGSDSYCGPWLASVLFEVERALLSDLAPVLTVGEVNQRERALLDAERKLASDRAAFDAARINTELSLSKRRADLDRRVDQIRSLLSSL